MKYNDQPVERPDKVPAQGGFEAVVARYGVSPIGVAFQDVPPMDNTMTLKADKDRQDRIKQWGTESIEPTPNEFPGGGRPPRPVAGVDYVRPPWATQFDYRDADIGRE